MTDTGESRDQRAEDSPGNEATARADDSFKPRDLKVKIAEQRLVIDWKDGVRSDLSLAELRRICPCATCRTDREEGAKNPLRILRSNPEGIRVVHAQLVGNYAIRLDWSDGHSTGIFEFRMLRGVGNQSKTSS
ncbi:MAG: DUF971 domain-containing protein [Planctomycetota bacterium]